MIALAACASSDDRADPIGRDRSLRDAGRDAGDAGGSEPAATRTPRVVLPPEPLAVLAGPRYAPAPERNGSGFYGTDLGVSTEHGDEIRILFGDTWASQDGALIDPERDDVQGVISARDEPGGFPDGDAVDAFIAAQRPGSGPLAAAAPWWLREAPAIVFEPRDDGGVAPFELYREGRDDAPVNMGIGKAVMTVFSNARDGVFAIFRRDVAVACAPGASGGCGDRFSCDQGLGICADATGEYAPPCVIASSSARCGGGACVAVAGGGYCQDRSSSLYLEGDDDGRVEAVVIAHEVGVADPQRPRRYATQPWITNKFTNPLAKTVADFDPERDPAANDYRPADGSQPAREKVLLWARPHTVGTRAAGRDARLYFAYADMPEHSSTAQFAWSPQYFAGLERGRPIFSPLQTDAAALDLGGAPQADVEAFDVVDRAAVSYLADWKLWVMLYGGDFAPPILNLFVGPSWPRVQRHPRGAIHARFARQPWGPWSAPVSILEAGDANLAPPAQDSQYAAHGMLAHYACSGACIPPEIALSHALTPYGFLYAPNIFDRWTELREDGDAIDLYWNVSTWNPYQVVLLRTRLER